MASESESLGTDAVQVHHSVVPSMVILNFSLPVAALSVTIGTFDNEVPRGRW